MRASPRGTPFPRSACRSRYEEIPTHARINPGCDPTYHQLRPANHPELPKKTPKLQTSAVRPECPSSQILPMNGLYLGILADRVVLATHTPPLYNRERGTQLLSL